MKSLRNLLQICGVASLVLATPFCYAEDEDDYSDEQEAAFAEQEAKLNAALQTIDDLIAELDAPPGANEEECELLDKGVDVEEIEQRFEEALEAAREAFAAMQDIADDNDDDDKDEEEHESVDAETLDPEEEASQEEPAGEAKQE